MTRNERRRMKAMGAEMKGAGDPRFATLANGFSNVVNLALRSGMEPDECCCVMASIVADYARYYYGDEYLEKLALVVAERAGHPMPDMETQH